MSETGAHRVRVVDPSNGAVTTLAGSGAAAMVDGTGTSAAFSFPQQLAFWGGALVVADRAGVRAYRTPAPACPADLNGDGAVSAPDLAAMLSAWGGAGAGDLNGDGSIGAQDLAALLSAWGACQ